MKLICPECGSENINTRGFTGNYYYCKDCDYHLDVSHRNIEFGGENKGYHDDDREED